MKKTLIIIFLFSISNLLSFTAQSKEKIKFKSLHSQGMTTIFLVDPKTTKSQLSKHGNRNCSAKSFCVIWYFDNSKKAQTGIKRAKSGNMFDPIPGLIAIYSKNRMVNKIICHEPKGTC